MKRLLRSVIDADGAIPQEDLCANFQHLIGAKIVWSRPEETRLFDFVLAFFRQQLAIPGIQTLRDHFEAQNDIEVGEYLGDVLAVRAYTRSNFIYLLKSILEDQNRVRAVALLKETHEIVVKGAQIEGQRLQGVKDGLIHFTRRANELVIPEHNARIRGNLRNDGQEVWDEYLAAEADKGKAYGKATGINAIDTTCHGIKKGELWIHAAFAGELKSTFATNWGYNLVTRYRSNVFYVSLEMKYDHLRRIIYTIHSANAKWMARGKPELDYRKIRDGELSPQEKAFYFESSNDFATNPGHCAFEIWTPEHEVTVSDIRTEAEVVHKSMDIGLVVIDHGGLVQAEKHRRNKDYTVELNSVIRDAKRMALNFNGGEGVPVLLLFQINRMGKDDAEKNEGVYKMKALSYSNEAERSADVITTTYLNKALRDKGSTIFCNLKNRDNPLFDPFEAAVNFKTRRMGNLDPFQSADGRGMSVDDHRDVQSALWGV